MKCVLGSIIKDINQPIKLGLSTRVEFILKISDKKRKKTAVAIDDLYNK